MNLDINKALGNVANSIDQALTKGLRRLSPDSIETKSNIIRAGDFGVNVFDKLTKALVKTIDAASVGAQNGAQNGATQAGKMTEVLSDGTKLLIELLKSADGTQTSLGNITVESALGGREVLDASITCRAPGSAFGSNTIDDLWSKGTALPLPSLLGGLFDGAFGNASAANDSPLAFLAERGRALAGGAADPTKFIDQLKNLDLADIAKFNPKDLLDTAGKAIFCPGPAGGLGGVNNKVLEALAKKILEAIGNGAAFGALGPQVQGGMLGFNALRQLMALLQNALAQNGGAPPQVLPGFGRPGGLPDFTRPGFEIPPGFRGPIGTNDPKLPIAPIGNDDFKSGVLSRIRGIDGQIDSIKSALASGKVPKEDMLTLQLELQELQELKRQLVEMLTSTMKSEHDANMAVIRNLAV